MRLPETGSVVPQYARRNLRHCVQYTQYAAVPQCDAASYTVTQSGAIRRLSLRAFQFSKESFFPKYFISDLFEREILINQQV